MDRFFVRYRRSQRRAVSTKAFSCEIEKEKARARPLRDEDGQLHQNKSRGSDSDKGGRGGLLTWEMGLRCFFIFVRKRNEFSLPPNKESGHVTRFLRIPRYYGNELLRRVVSWAAHQENPAPSESGSGWKWGFARQYLLFLRF